MYFMIAGPENRRTELDFSDKRGYLRKADGAESGAEYYYYKWAKTEDFARNELDKAKKELGCKAQLFTLSKDKYLLCVDEAPAAYISEEEIEEQRQISSKAFFEHMLFILPTYIK